jgi:hypothetical protein
MSTLTDQQFPYTITPEPVKWAKGSPFVCWLCGSPLIFRYSGNPRFIITLFGICSLIFEYYQCTNPNCGFHHPFTLPQDLVLPNKRYGRDVWEKVIRHCVESGDNLKGVKSDLDIDFGLKISIPSIDRIWKTYLALQSAIADQRTLSKVQLNKQMILRIDGKRPQAGHPSLWVFTDVLTNQIVYTILLKHIDALQLGEILREIERKYGVSIKCVISDHQNVIVKSVHDALPNAIHQFCHFHFLANLVKPLEAMDGHLHKTLEKAINALYINRAGLHDQLLLASGKKMGVQTIFEPIMNDLKRIIGFTSRRFSEWAGLNAFDQLNLYSEEITKACKQVPVNSRQYNLLMKTYLAIKQSLTSCRVLAQKLRALILRFEPFHLILTDPLLSAEEMKQWAEKWTQAQKDFVATPASSKIQGRSQKFVVKIKTLTYRASITAVILQWITLFMHHMPGLFEFDKIKGCPRTNVAQEQDFSYQSQYLRRRSGKGQIGYQTRVYGDDLLRLRKTYSSNKIQAALEYIGVLKSTHRLATYAARRKEERKNWQNHEEQFQGVKDFVQSLKN